MDWDGEGNMYLVSLGSVSSRECCGGRVVRAPKHARLETEPRCSLELINVHTFDNVCFFFIIVLFIASTINF